jgi:hypothetical protein
MGRTIAMLLLCAPALASAATPSVAGRWEGQVRIPGRMQPVIFDLAQDAGGRWTGSIILPGLGIKGAPLAHIVTQSGDVNFDVGDVLADQAGEPAAFKARLVPGRGMQGEMRQGGNVAKFNAVRVGTAQVELLRRSTPVGAAIAAQWTGDFELGGYPRHVTITIENHGDAAATAQFVVAGKQTNVLPVDKVIEDGDFLRIESHAAHAAFEGRHAAATGEIRGVVELDELEVPLVLRRAAGGAS